MESAEDEAWKDRLVKQLRVLGDLEIWDDRRIAAGGRAVVATRTRHSNRLEEAEPLMQRAVKIWEQSLGPEHPDT
jgi:hypothetical protein